MLTYVVDAKTVRAWRSETLTSIAVSTEFTGVLTKECKYLEKNIFGELELFFPIIKGDHDSLATFDEKVLRPAVNLAIAIQTSPTIYTFRPRMTREAISKSLILSKEDLVDSKIIDAKTAKTLKADSPVVAKQNGTIGNQIALLTPSLIRCTPGEKPVRLTPEVVLAELYHPLRHRRANSVQPN